MLVDIMIELDSGDYCHAGLLFHLCPDVAVAPLLTQITMRPQSNRHVYQKQDPVALAYTSDETTANVHRPPIDSQYLQTNARFAPTPLDAPSSQAEDEADDESCSTGSRKNAPAT